MNYDVFISYSRRDKQFADALVHHLEARGVKCWIDYRDLYAGSDWAQEIDRAIKNNPGLVLILIFSAHVNESDQIIKEINLAGSYKIPIIPVKIEDVDFSGGYAYHLGHINWMNAFSEEEHNNIEGLAEKLKTTIFRIRERNGIGVAASAEETRPAPTTVVAGGIEEKKTPSAPSAGGQVSWPDSGIAFLKNLRDRFDIAALPFKPVEISSDNDVAESLEMDWSVDDHYYFAVWFEGKRSDKVDLLCGYYSEYEKRDPLFRKTAEAFV